MELRLRCPAKLNLGLEILHRREDGYHELRTVFQSLEFHDELSLSTKRGSGLALEVLGERGGVPETADNLVARAWEAFGREFGGAPALRVKLRKRIPAGSGLGGGSSDAAAMLLGLVRLTGREGNRPRLAGVAGTLGADVPYFLLGGTALGLARGDEVYPLAGGRPRQVLLLLPGEGVSTAAAYRAASARLTRRENSISLHRCFSEKGEFRPLRELQRNDLEEAIFRQRPELGRLKEALYRLGAELAGMSGSGSALFALFRAREKAEAAAAALAGECPRAVITATLERRRYLRYLYGTR